MRPAFLNRVPLAEVFPYRPGAQYMTMGLEQWDALLATAYEDGWVLVEVDARERPVRAFRKERPS